MPFVLHRKLPQALSLIHDMSHQAEVPLHQDIPGLHISLGRKGKIMAFLFLGQGLGKAAGRKLQGI